MASLSEIRARLAAQDDKKAGNFSGGDKVVYPHWNIKEGESARLRFLPDQDPANDFFWIEKLTIKLPFSGVKGRADSKPLTVQVPCMEQYGEACPILAQVRPWYKDETLKETAGKYWKKKSYLLQGFVRENPIAEDETPENPIRRFVISPQIFASIRAALMDPELEEMPTDYNRGLDYIVSKTTKGTFADYSTSKWSRKETALTTEELKAVDDFGLFNLRDFLPKKPTEVELKAIVEMFEASVDGQLYDLDRWGAYYKPFGLGDSDNSNKTESKSDVKDNTVVSTKTETTPVKENAVAQTSSVTGSSRAQDILNQIKNRKK